jgi:osmotically inducible protein OsmC
MTRKGLARWHGGLKDGGGTLSTESGALSDQKYDFRARFEGGGATNPEELLAAALAACYSMALSANLAEEDMTAAEIATTASVTIENLSIDKCHLEVRARVPNGDAEAFRRAAEKTKAGCPVSKLFKAEITLDAALS